MNIQVRFGIRIALVAAMLCIHCVELYAATPIGERSFRLHVVGNYAVHWYGLDDPRGDSRAVLIKIDRGGRFESWENLVDPVLEYSCHGQIIFGKRPNDFFILDIRKQNPEPVYLETQAAWEDALKEFGVPLPVHLNDPLQVAATLSDQELYPEDYRFMNSKWGLTDIQWNNYVQLLALLICVAIGFIFWGNKVLQIAGELLTIPCIFLGVGWQTMMTGDGLDRSTILIVMPLMCFIGLFSGRAIRKVISRKKHKEESSGNATPDK